jgi:hypothetical protein
MKHLGITALSLALLSSAYPSALCRAQSADSSGANPSAPAAQQPPTDLSGSSYKARPIPQVEVATPFPVNAAAAEKTDPLEFVPPDQMSATDRSLAAAADSRIRDEATLAGIELSVGKWSYQQLVCKALPDHVFLIYKGDNGPGDISLFSAVIPRSSTGRVRVIPVERRGYSLFSPAPVNAITISAFNRIRADEPANKSADWLATALCYAALAGARPALTSTPKDSAGADFPLDFPPTLEIGASGDSTVRFVDLASVRAPSEWALTFSSKGQLLKVDHFATPNFAVTPIPSK